ncbi:MAG: hypothetical protein PVI27_07905 [Desulfobacteraceae bacterium]
MLAETDRLFTCAYCRVRVCLRPRKFFHYRLPLRSPAREDLLYFPYWRFKGTLFSAGPAGVAHRLMDISRKAHPHPAFPVSLGFRPQALRMQFVLPDTPGHFIRPSLPLAQATGLCTDRRARRQGPCEARIGESVSLIYAPYYIGPKLIDGVLERAVGGGLAQNLEPGELCGGPPQGGIDFIAAVCPECGWDLEGGRTSAALVCGGCRRVWQPGAAGLESVACAHAAGAADGRHLPFWRIAADIRGIAPPLAEALGALPEGSGGPADGGYRLRFWVPAFKLPPKNFLRLAGQLTFAAAREKLSAGAPAGNRHPVTLPAGEAVESLPIHLASRLVGLPGQTAPWPPQVRVSTADPLLVYLPFNQTAHDLVHPSGRIAVNRQTLTHSDAL